MEKSTNKLLQFKDVGLIYQSKNGETEALKKAEKIMADARHEASEYWNSIYLKLTSYVSGNSELQRLLSLDFLNLKINSIDDDTSNG